MKLSNNPASMNRLAAPISPTNKSKRSKLVAILWLALILTGAVAYFYHANQIKKDQAFQADKVRFAQVETDMKVAYDAMVLAAGAPKLDQHYQSCSYTSRKFEKGMLWCGESYRIVYDNMDYVKSLNTLEVLQNELINIKTFTLKEGAFSADSIDTSNSRYKPVQISFYNNLKVHCELGMEYTPPMFREELRSIRRDYATVYSLDCSRGMNRPIYTLAK